MNEKTVNDIHAHAIADYPREACGLVCVVKGREKYIPCRNNAAVPNEQFILDPEDYAMAEDQGEIIAVIHTHPNASPKASVADRISCENSGLPWHIFHVSIPDGESEPKVGDMVTIEPSGYEVPLVGRPFVHGVLDCYTLIRDYFKREQGIELLDWMRNDGWWDEGKNLYMDHYAETGFSPIHDEPRVGDVIFMQIRSPVPNHAGVYLGNDLILHHLYGRLSSRDIYGGYLQEMTRLIIRHKDMKYV